MRYTVCVGSLSLVYCNQLDKKVSSAFLSLLMRGSDRSLVAECDTKEQCLGGGGLPNGMGYSLASCCYNTNEYPLGGYHGTLEEE